MGAKHLVILNLHGIGEPPGAIPSDEVQYWVARDFFVELLERVGRSPRVRFTFDDGNESDFELAFPELAKRGLRAEFFVLAGRLDEPGYLTASHLREMAAAGMGIGLHGMHHRSWAQCDDEELGVEIDEARREIESILGRPLLRAACPFGAYDAASLRKLKRSGFERVYTSDGGVTKPAEWLQARNTLRSSHRLSDVEALVERPPTGLQHWGRRLRTFAKSNRRRMSH